MAFYFDPALQLDLDEPIRVELVVPVHLLHRFHPSIQPVLTPGKLEDVMTPHNPLKALKPTALIIAELVSNEMFGSTEAVRENLQVIGRWRADGTLRGIYFYLHHRLREEDVGLNPEYIRIFAREDDGGQLVLRPEVVTGESRVTDNDWAEGRQEMSLGPELALL